MRRSVTVRTVRETDFESWLPLWRGYNAFYGREGTTALDPEISKTTWRRFFDSNEPVFALVAEAEGKLLGLTHFLHHRSTTRIELSTDSRTAYLRYVTSALLGRRWNIDGIDLVSCSEIVCRLPEPPGNEVDKNDRVYVEADGELLGRLPARMTMSTDALSIAVPAAKH